MFSLWLLVWLNIFHMFIGPSCCMCVCVCGLCVVCGCVCVYVCVLSAHAQCLSF